MTFGYQVLGFGSGSAKKTFIVATGGTVSTIGDFKVHTFTGPGTFCVSCVGNQGAEVSYIVVAGGGAGG